MSIRVEKLQEEFGELRDQCFRRICWVYIDITEILMRIVLKTMAVSWELDSGNDAMKRYGRRYIRNERRMENDLEVAMSGKETTIPLPG